MMQDTHRPEEERARPSYKRAQGPKGAYGRAPLQSPRFLKTPLGLSYCSGLLSQGPLGGAPALCCSPLEERFGETWFPDGCLAAPAATLKLSVLLTTDHDQVEFLGTDPAGLHSPQVDHQLAAWHLQKMTGY